MRIWKATLAASVASLVLVPAAVAVTASPAVAVNPNHVVVGAIRWDGQIGDSAAGELAGVGPEEETALGPAKWHSRIPFYASVTGTNSISMNGATQSVIDQEIAMAHDAGIDYWAFDWYGDETGMQTARELYLSSSLHNEINWAAILWTHPLSEADLNTLTSSQFEASNYQKVDGGRPLLYLYNYSQYVSAAQISELKTKTFTAMGKYPYIVALDYSSGGAANLASTVGADGVSSYVTSGSGHGAYSSTASGEQNNWNSYKSTGYGVIPWVTTGWDPQPRVQSSPAYTYASYGASSGTTEPTPGELAAQLQSAINWDATNSSSAPAQAVLMYAWNEISEGGRIEPSISSRDNLDAIKSVLVGGSADNGSVGAPVITADSPSTLRNNYGDFDGMSFTTGASSLTVQELGRKYVSGNSQVHIVKLVRASDNVDVGSVLLGHVERCRGRCRVQVHRFGQRGHAGRTYDVLPALVRG